MALHIQVKVIPQSGKNGWVLDKNKSLKCYLKSAPEKGKANQELIDLVAKALRISKQKVSIVSGLTSRTKRIYIEHEIALGAFMQALGLERQEEIF